MNRPRLDSTQEMAGIDLDELRKAGVTKASFHADGSLASVEFGPSTSSSDEDSTQPNSLVSPKRRSVTGGLVPRGGDVIERDS